MGFTAVDRSLLTKYGQQVGTELHTVIQDIQYLLPS